VYSLLILRFAHLFIFLRTHLLHTPGSMWPLSPRAHTQSASDKSTFETHWGYVPRILPCTNNRETCEYLDARYGNHDKSMLFNLILWAVIAGLILVAMTLRATKSSIRLSSSNGGAALRTCDRLLAGYNALYRRLLLPESSTFLFGHISRVQILVLLITVIYLIVFS
jgi:hypothetical protein